MIFRPSRRPISALRKAGEGFEQFVHVLGGHGAEVEDEAVVEDARDDGGRLSSETFVEPGRGVARVCEGDERGRRVRGRGRAAADGRLAVDEVEVERVRAET